MNIRIKVLLFFILTTINHVLANEKKSLQVLISSEDENLDEDVKVENENFLDGINSVFVPTNEWKVIKPDEAIPRGIHVRMNLATGLKEGKLINEKESSSADNNNAVNTKDFDLHNVGQYAKEWKKTMKENLKNIKSEDNMSPEELMKESKERKTKFKSYENIKADFAEMNMKVETDGEIITRLLGKFKTKSKDPEDDLIHVLQDLEFLLHQIDNAIVFVDSGGINSIIKPGINSTNDAIKSETFTIIGSSSQNNAKVQIAMVEAGLVRELLHFLQMKHPSQIKRKAMYALSCIVRGFPYAQQDLILNGGLDILKKQVDNRGETDVKLKVKIISLMQDLLKELEDESASAERKVQLTQVDIKRRLVQAGWCQSVLILLNQIAALEPSSNIDEELDHSAIKTIVSMMVDLGAPCKTDFFSASSVVERLHRAYHKVYHDHVRIGSGIDGFYEDILNDIRKIILLIQIRSEL